MATKIESIRVNLFGGQFSAEIKFNPNLNIISGENGTGKTQLLRTIKSANGLKFVGGQGNQQHILAISPKRNTIKNTLDSVIGQFRQQNKNIDTITTEKIQAQLEDNTFVNYNSLSELFYVYYEKKCRDGGEQIKKMQEVTTEFNGVIQSVFPNYQLISNWNSNSGLPQISIFKNGTTPIPIQNLSTGEQEVFSLILNLHVVRERVEIILIDEPEIHLNWHLEDRLFDFFQDFSIHHDKQIIVATHSRTIFQSKYYSLAQFLAWENDKIVVAKDLTPQQRKKIGGEAIEIIKLGNFNKVTFFVEDMPHELFLKNVSDIYKKDISYSKVDNSNNVKSIYKLSQKDGGWPNSFFLIDGDNMGNPYPGSPNFFHLEKYCIENYYLSIPVLAQFFKKSEDHIKGEILIAIKTRRDSLFKKTKGLEFLVDRLTANDLTQEALDKLDASEIIYTFLQGTQMKYEDFVPNYISFCSSNNLLETVFPKNLIETIKNA